MVEYAGHYRNAKLRSTQRQTEHRAWGVWHYHRAAVALEERGAERQCPRDCPPRSSAAEITGGPGVDVRPSIKELRKAADGPSWGVREAAGHLGAPASCHRAVRKQRHACLFYLAVPRVGSGIPPAASFWSFFPYLVSSRRC